MPTYDYQCGTCGNRFEKFQSFSDEPIKICPECGNAVKKVISAAGIVFKGSGWYITDSRKASTAQVPAPATASSDSPAASASATDSPAKGSSDTANSSSGSTTESTPKSGDSSPATSAKASTKTEAA